MSRTRGDAPQSVRTYLTRWCDACGRSSFTAPLSFITSNRPPPTHLRATLITAGSVTLIVLVLGKEGGRLAPTQGFTVSRPKIEVTAYRCG